MRTSVFRAKQYISWYLENHGIIEYDAEARLIIDHLSHKYHDVSSNFIRDAIFILRERIKKKPIHYVLGYKYFYGLKFHLNESCLIPRFDSECIVEYCINYAKSFDKAISILDLFCGSGCLGTSLMHEINLKSECTFVDIQTLCLEISQKNSDIIDNSKQFLNLDLMQDISYNMEKKFDIIISNPPYIPSQEIQSLEPETSIFEPKISLDGGCDGLEFYRVLANNISKLMHRNSLYVTEIGDNQEGDIISIFHKYKHISNIKDLTGKIRGLAFIV